MKHGFSQQDWFEYTCGDLTEERRSELDRHLAICTECRKSARELAAMDSMLSRMASRLRESIPVTPEEISEGYRAAAMGTDRGYHGASQRVIWLKLYLSKICGKHTAGRALQRAANEASAESVELVTPGQWEVFVNSLSGIVGDLCGDPASRLLQAIGYAR